MFRLAVVTCLLLVAAAHPITFDQLDTVWEQFKNVHKRDYKGEVDTVRKQIFVQNLRKIQQHNIEADLGQHSYWLGINRFADQTKQEYLKLNGFKISAKRANRTKTAETFLPPENMPELPPSVDWRTKGYVTEVKNQGQCGSCWAFSATGSMEGQHFRSTKKLVSLSEQNLVDCSGPEGNEGCDGGTMDDAFQYVIKNKGVDTEKCYPYHADDETCKFKRSCVGTIISGYTDVTPQEDEKALQAAVATQGPISVAIDASQESFRLYSHGIYDEPNCSSQDLDHGVLAVGYGTKKRTGAKSQDYWIVKNSWGETWGMQGYLLMSRNKNNQCGIATMASFPRI